MRPALATRASGSEPVETAEHASNKK